MKKRNFFHMACGMLLLAFVAGLAACSSTDGDDSGVYELDGIIGDAAPKGEGGEPGGSQSGNSQAGIVTAGEWCDLVHWPFWSRLMLASAFAGKSDYWRFYTNQRVCVQVTDEAGEAVAGVSVKLLRQNGSDWATLWEAVTDNHGQADCWIGLFQHETADPNTLQVSIDGTVMEEHPIVCAWDSLASNGDFDAALPVAVNRYVCTKAPRTAQQADIAFVVDATGSMSDEIEFLQSDLTDILGKVAAVRPSMKMRTAALFYRDKGDEYLTRHSDFSTDFGKTQKFVNEQNASGGGDYPEAVHTALEGMLQDLSWSTDARARLAFLLLDAPAHHENEVIRSLQKSVSACAKAGIRLIPVAASGVDKNTEFMLRFFAIATGGTYVFITNDSGVGLDHIAASVGHYDVEQLNELIIRLIARYTE